MRMLAFDGDPSAPSQEEVQQELKAAAQIATMKALTKTVYLPDAAWLREYQRHHNVTIELQITRVLSQVGDAALASAAAAAPPSAAAAAAAASSRSKSKRAAMRQSSSSSSSEIPPLQDGDQNDEVAAELWLCRRQLMVQTAALNATRLQIRTQCMNRYREIGSRSILRQGDDDGKTAKQSGAASADKAQGSPAVAAAAAAAAMDCSDDDDDDDDGDDDSDDDNDEDEANAIMSTIFAGAKRVLDKQQRADSAIDAEYLNRFPPVALLAKRARQTRREERREVRRHKQQEIREARDADAKKKRLAREERQRIKRAADTEKKNARAVTRVMASLIKKVEKNYARHRRASSNNTKQQQKAAKLARKQLRQAETKRKHELKDAARIQKLMQSMIKTVEVRAHTEARAEKRALRDRARARGRGGARETAAQRRNRQDASRAESAMPGGGSGGSGGSGGGGGGGSVMLRLPLSKKFRNKKPVPYKTLRAKLRRGRCIRLRKLHPHGGIGFFTPGGYEFVTMHNAGSLRLGPPTSAVAAAAAAAPTVPATPPPPSSTLAPIFLSSSSSVAEKKTVDGDGDVVMPAPAVVEPVVERYCVCRSVYDETLFYIQCETCGDWLHGACVDITNAESEWIQRYICWRC
jgi:hypothetical protein